MDADWQNNFVSMQDRNSHLLSTGLRTDCRFLVGVYDENQSIVEAHKHLLSTASSVFEAMFFGPLAEKNDPILIEDIEPEIFKDLLRFIYTEKDNIDSMEKAQQLYYAADKYALSQLKKTCASYLRTHLTSGNACQVFEFSKHYGDSNLERSCMEVIVTKTSEVLISETFYQAKLSTLETIFSLNKLNISSELRLFEALQQYAVYRNLCDELIDRKVEGQGKRSHSDAKKIRIQEQKQKTSKNTKALPNLKETHRIELLKLVKKMRFLTLTPAEFTSGPALSTLLTKDDAFAILICLIDPKNIEKHFPHGYSDSKNTRFEPTNNSGYNQQGTCRTCRRNLRCTYCGY